MTLIAAFRCNADGRPAVVVCADSQETVDDAYRVEVAKIKPRDAGNYDLIIGGSGYIDTLIDGLADAIEQSVKRWPAGEEEEKARIRIEQVLRAYHSRHVDRLPDPNIKLLRFIVCLRDKTSSQIYLWKTNETTARRVDNHTLLGWEEAAYHYEVEWLYYPEIPIAQAALLGVHLFSVAQNSLYIGGPTQIIVVRENGMHVKREEEVDGLIKQVADFNKRLGRLLLACFDLSIPQDAFVTLFEDYGNSIMEMRDYFIEEVAKSMTYYTMADPNYQVAYMPIPRETFISYMKHVADKGIRFTSPPKHVKAPPRTSIRPDGGMDGLREKLLNAFLRSAVESARQKAEAQKKKTNKSLTKRTARKKAKRNTNKRKQPKSK